MRSVKYKSADELFYAEFKALINARRGFMPQYNLTSLIPPNLYKMFWRETHPIGYIYNIKEKYYDQLNDSEVLIWKNPTLNRREFHYNGEYKKDKDGNYILKEVALPQDCVAVLSPKMIGVPLKFKAENKDDHFEYVDSLVQTRGNNKVTLYVYLIPKKYVYLVRQTALVISSYRLGNFYSGVKITLTNGQKIFLFIVDYKPSNQMRNNAIVLHTKTDIDYSKEIEALKREWLTHNIMFDPSWCELKIPVKEITNTAFESLVGNGAIYNRYDLSEPLSKTQETFEDINADWNDEENENNIREQK